jgi:COMPASS component SWD3
MSFKEQISASCTTLEFHSKAVVALKYTDDGRRLATASADKTANIYDTSSGKLLMKLEKEHTLGLNDIAWMDDGRYLATASDDKSIKIWDVEMGKAVTTLHGNKSFIYCLAVHPENQMLLSGGHDGSIRLFHAPSRSCLMNFDAHAGAIVSVAYSPEEGRNFISGSHDGMIRTWDSVNYSATLTSFHCDYSPPVSCARYSPNGKYLLVSTLDDHIRLFPADDNVGPESIGPVVKPPPGSAKTAVANQYRYEPLKTYKGHKQGNYTMQTAFFSGDLSSATGKKGDTTKLVVSGSEDNLIYLWDADSMETQQTLEGHTDVVLAVACNPDESMLQIASASVDKTVKLWRWDAGGAEDDGAGTEPED